MFFFCIFQIIFFCGFDPPEMTEINTVFESPVSLLTFNEPILTIFNTQKYFYVATKDTLSRFEIKNQLKAKSH